MSKRGITILVVLFSLSFLVAMVGMTFAYYAANVVNKGGSGNVHFEMKNEEQVGKVNIDILTVAANNEAKIEYPGGMMVVGEKIVVSTDGNYKYNLNYSLKASVDSRDFAGSNSELKWGLYELTSEVSGDLVTGCKLVEVVGESENHYYYGDCTPASEIVSGNLIKSGTITNHSEITNIKITNKEINNVTKSDSKSTYYYLVVEYLNKEDSNQAVTDAGKRLTVKLEGIEDQEAIVDFR